MDVKIVWKSIPSFLRVELIDASHSREFTRAPSCAIILRIIKYIIRDEGGSLDKEQKTEVIDNFKHHEGDTGSTEVQVALLTGRIIQLTKHMTDNRHDYHTQRGLLKLVGQRRRLLAYLAREDAEK